MKWSGVYDLLADRSEAPSRGAGLDLLKVRAGEKALEVGFGAGHSPVRHYEVAHEADVDSGRDCPRHQAVVGRLTDSGGRLTTPAAARYRPARSGAEGLAGRAARANAQASAGGVRTVVTITITTTAEKMA